MTQKELERVLTENKLELDEFNRFIENQTLGINKDGTINYYEYDVERFVSKNTKK